MPADLDCGACLMASLQPPNRARTLLGLRSVAPTTRDNAVDMIVMMWRYALLLAWTDASNNDDINIVEDDDRRIRQICVRA